MVLCTVFWELMGIRTSQRSCKMSQSKHWAVGENKGRKMKILLDIPQQEPNHFINGFMEHPQGVCQYPNEP